MTDVRTVTAADVYKGDVLAATLERTEGGVRFAYRVEYSASGGLPVATGLPLGEHPLFSVAGSVPPFFAGLLPEGARLQALTRRVKTSADDMLSLLLAVGSDCIGDVRVVPAGADPQAAAPLALVTSWDTTDFEELFAASIAVGGDAYERTALPGVQEKVSAAMIGFPVAGGGVSHILKLAPERYPRLIENEAFVMAFAAAAGLPVAPDAAQFCGRYPVGTCTPRTSASAPVKTGSSSWLPPTTSSPTFPTPATPTRLCASMVAT